MPSRHHYVEAARELERSLDGKAFRSIPRMEITEMVRRISGEENTRLKAGESGSSLEQALLEQGVRCFPSLLQTSTNDTIRLFRIRKVAASLLDILLYPSVETDAKLASVVTKIKGNWDWTKESPSA